MHTTKGTLPKPKYPSASIPTKFETNNNLRKENYRYNEMRYTFNNTSNNNNNNKESSAFNNRSSDSFIVDGDVGRPRENDGFSRRTQRFDDPENDLPGPGTYYQPSTTLNTSSASFSTKGYGNLVSQSKRFYEAPRPLFSTPGPGNYQTHDFVYESLTSHPTNHVRSLSASFASSTTRTDFTKGRSQSPGPGRYDVVAASLKTAPSPASASAAFRSGTARLPDPKTPVPGPGAYDVLAAVSHTSLHARDPKEDKKENAVFKSKTRQHDFVGITAKASGSVPGPGAYKPGAPENLDTRTILYQKKPSSVFIVSSVLDRFGNVKYKKPEVTPGPGDYDVDVGGSGSRKEDHNTHHNHGHNNRLNFKSATVHGTRPTNPTTKAMSVFASSTSRFNDSIGFNTFLPPGPAYYKQNSSMIKRTHNLNASKKWL